MDDLSTIRSAALEAVQAAADLGALDAARVAVLGKKGSVTGLMKTLGGMAPDEGWKSMKLLEQLMPQLKAKIAETA